MCTQLFTLLNVHTLTHTRICQLGTIFQSVNDIYWMALGFCESGFDFSCQSRTRGEGSVQHIMWMCGKSFHVVWHAGKPARRGSVWCVLADGAAAYTHIHAPRTCQLLNARRCMHLAHRREVGWGGFVGPSGWGRRVG